MLSINNRTALSSTRALKTLLLSAALISLGANSALAKTSDTTIHFSKGAISSVVTGKLKPNEQERWYRFNAAAAQYADARCYNACDAFFARQSRSCENRCDLRQIPRLQDSCPRSCQAD